MEKSTSKSTTLARILSYVQTIESEKLCLIPSDDIIVFTSICDTLGLLVNGGAFDMDSNKVNGQYFYI